MAFKLGKIDKTWAKGATALVGGGVVGVLADKLVGNTFTRFGIPNPEFYHIQMHDVLLVAGELYGAYRWRNRSGKKGIASKVLLGMASAVITTDAFQMVGTAPWFGYAYTPMTLNRTMQLNIRPRMANGVVGAGYQKVGGGAGKYAMQVANSARASSTVGRYR